MFGNLFNQKKVNREDQQVNEQVGTEIKVEQATSPDILGGDIKTQQTIKITEQNKSQNFDSQSKITATPAARENITALSRLDPRATKVLNQAQTLAKNNNQANIEPGHMLYGLLYDSEVFKLLEQFGVDV